MIATRVRVAALACVALSCTPPQSPAFSAARPRVTVPPPPDADLRTHSRPASLQEQLVLRQLMRETERIRGLAFQRPVAMYVEDAQGMRAYVRRALDDADITRSRQRYAALGLIDANLDIRDLLERLLEEELIGYYDPISKHLVVRDDLAAALGRGPTDPSALALRETLVHELVHALQDQHLGLSAQLHAERTTDAENAYAALVEGDAQLAMLAYALSTRGQALASALAEDPALESTIDGAGLRLSATLENAPPLVREPLLFRYREGVQYAGRLYREGGFGRVDSAHHNPPSRTAEVLAAAPDRSRRALREVVPPSHACIADAGYARVDEDSLGALEIAIVTARNKADRNATARAVLTDRYHVLRRADALAAVWIVQLESAPFALRVARAFARHEDHAGERRVFRQHDRVLVLTGLSEACAEALAAASSFSRLP